MGGAGAVTDAGVFTSALWLTQRSLWPSGTGIRSRIAAFVGLPDGDDGGLYADAVEWGV